MDRVFSVEEISEQFWSSPPQKDGNDASSAMNRSSSEWAFQRFLQEAESSSPSPKRHQKLHSVGENDVVEIKVKDDLPDLSSSSSSRNHENSKIDASLSAKSNGNNNIPLDAEDYQAFLKSKLNLACAAVALSRVNSFIFVFNFRNFHGR